MQGDKNKRAGSADGLSRRRFLAGVGVVGVGAMVAEHPLLRAAEPQPVPARGADIQTISGPTSIVLQVNGQDRKVTVEPRATLLSALRDQLDPPVTGPKLVCDMGTCGACTVLLDDKPVYACLVLALDAVGKKITTIEGLGSLQNLSAVQAEFVDKDALMCGFCTPGFVISVSALLAQNPHPTLEEVREACKGNFCRCGAYPRVFEAALAVAGSAGAASGGKSHG